MDWARHPGAVRGIAYLETLTGPVSWDGPNAPDPDPFGPLRTAAGEQMVLGENVFVERVLPAGTLLRLNDEEMDAYRRKVSTVMIVIDTAERISAAFDVVEERTSEGFVTSETTPAMRAASGYHQQGKAPDAQPDP